MSSLTLTEINNKLTFDQNNINLINNNDKDYIVDVEKFEKSFTENLYNNIYVYNYYVYYFEFPTPTNKSQYERVSKKEYTIPNLTNLNNIISIKSTIEISFDRGSSYEYLNLLNPFFRKGFIIESFFINNIYTIQMLYDSSWIVPNQMTFKNILINIKYKV